MSVKSFGRGGKSTANRQSPTKAGGTSKPSIGRKGNVSSTQRAGGASYSYLPAANSYPNAGIKGNNHTPKTNKGRMGKTWAHLPSDPTG